LSFVAELTSMAEQQTARSHKRKPDAIERGGTANSGSSAACDNSLQSWLAQCGSWCPPVVGPLVDALGAECASDLLELEPEDVDGVCDKLKKIQAKKFRRALQELKAAGCVVGPRGGSETSVQPGAAVSAAASTAEKEGRKRRKTQPEKHCCPICLEPMALPATLGCGHSGCRGCLARINETDQGGRQCPTCREIHKGPLVVNISMKAILEEELAQDSEYTGRLDSAVAELEAEKKATQREQDRATLETAGAATLATVRSRLISALYICVSTCVCTWITLP